MVKIINSWWSHFHQVLWKLNKNCGFFTNGQCLNVSCFFDSDFIRLCRSKGCKVGVRPILRIISSSKTQTWATYLGAPMWRPSGRIFLSLILIAYNFAAHQATETSSASFERSKPFYKHNTGSHDLQHIQVRFWSFKAQCATTKFSTKSKASNKTYPELISMLQGS